VDRDLLELLLLLGGHELLVARQARLGLRAPALGVRAHPLELGGDLALARLVLAVLLQQALLLGLQPGGVVALVRDALAAVELEDPARDVVQEVPVVGHGHDGAAVVGQVLLEPRDESASRWFVGSSRSRRSGWESSSRQSATRRRSPPERFVHGGVRRRAAQGVHRVLELGVEVPGVGRVDLRLQLGELVRGLVGVVHRQLVEALEQRLRRAHAVLDVLLDRLGLVQVRLLLEVADRGAREQLRVARDVVVQAAHDLEQRRLARAVVAEHADLRPLVEGERQVVEDRLVRRHALGDAVHRVDELLGLLGGHRPPG
jgi:hypothetical protein